MSVIQAFQRTARPAAIAVALLALSPLAHAQEQKPSPASMLIAKQLVVTTGAMALFSPLITGVVEQAKDMYLQQNPSLAKDLNVIADNMRKNLQPRFSELTDEVAKLYATHFTEQELKDMLAFYKSPTGQKMLTQQPLVINQSMKFAQNWANKLSEQVIEKMREELKKKGDNL
jgi:uncharacterized protein